MLGLFDAGLPFIIEILLMLDLVMLSIIAVLLAFGIDTSIEEFHERLNRVPQESIEGTLQKTSKITGSIKDATKRGKNLGSKTVRNIHKNHREYIKRHKEEILQSVHEYFAIKK